MPYNPNIPHINNLVINDIDQMRTNFQIIGYNIENIKNVKEYGAIGDGVTDDTQAIVDLFNNVQNGDIVFFPSGTYILKQEIVLNQKFGIEIIGTNNTTIKATGYNGLHFKFIDCSRIKIKRLRLEGEGINAVNSVGGIWFTLNIMDNNPYHLIEDVEIENITNSGITCAIPILFVARNVKIRYVVGNAFNFYNGTSVHLDTCYSLTTTKAGFSFTNMTYCSLTSCASEVSGIGYEFVNSKSIVCMGCGSEDQINRGVGYEGYAFKTDGQSVVLIGCYAKNSASGQHLLELNNGKFVIIDFFDGDTFTKKETTWRDII